MNAFRIMLLLAVFAAPALAVVEDGGGTFDRYNVILDRKPFGVAPAEPEAAAGPVAPQDSFASYVRLTALVQEEGGRVRVGFVDKKQKDKTYMLSVGEKVDDYEVLEADLEQEVAKIRKGTEEQWLSMKVAGAVGPPDLKKKPASLHPPPPAPTPLRMITPSSGMATGTVRRQSRYAAIRRAEIEREKLAEDARRRGIIREPPEDEEDVDDEEDDDEEIVIPGTPPPDIGEDEDEDEGDEVEIPVLQDGNEEDEEDEEDEDELIREAEIQQHLQNYQKDLIRQGLPPLPIPLTRESEKELEDDGTIEPMPAEED